MEIGIEYKHVAQTCAYKKVHTKSNKNRMYFIVSIMPQTTHYTTYTLQYSSVTCILIAVDYIQRKLSIRYITISLTL
jgi:hypothetical protein